MTEPGPETDVSTEDPASTMLLERVRRADGRYLIYYSWPDADAGQGDDRGDRPKSEPDV